MPQRWLYLVRHGHYDSDNHGMDGGALTELGRKQAAFVAEYLADVPVESIFTSTMTRAWETAQIIADRLNIPTVQPDNFLREVIPTVPPRFRDHFQQMSEQHSGFREDEVEQQRARADLAFAVYFQPPLDYTDVHQVVVCHGNIIRYFMALALDMNPDNWSRLMIHHCGVSIIAIDKMGNMDVIAHNETGYMPVQYRTEQ